MNATEKIVEAYFRLCKHCFTMPDVKVKHGNNRQIDLLAYNIIERKAYHIETGVTHCENWCPTPDVLIKFFDKKFFGIPSKKEGKNTDYTKGKTYIKEINNTYESVGLDPRKINRVWVCRRVINSEQLNDSLTNYCKTKGLSPDNISVMSFRDDIIPVLSKHISTSNYEDDMLRTISLIEQYRLQTRKLDKLDFQK